MIRAAFLAMIVLAAGALAQPSPTIGTGVARLDERLGALAPERPHEYFLLAEEVACEVKNAEGRALARRLFVLAYDLSNAGADPHRADVARSVCLALLELDLLADEDERRYVRALLASIEGQSGEGAPLGLASGQRSPAQAPPDDTAFLLATALGEYRAGRFQEANSLFQQGEVRALLAQHAPTLRNVAVMLRDVESRPNCRECRNRRIVRDDINPASRYRLCRTCGGDPSPALAPIDVVAMLRTESLLLDGGDSSWSAQIAVGRVEPFVDVDPALLAERLAVDTTRAVWREGGWMRADSAR